MQAGSFVNILNVFVIINNVYRWETTNEIEMA